MIKRDKWKKGRKILLENHLLRIMSNRDERLFAREEASNFRNASCA